LHVSVSALLQNSTTSSHHGPSPFPIPQVFLPPVPLGEKHNSRKNLGVTLKELYIYYGISLGIWKGG
jgi:hypothetical protein